MLWAEHHDILLRIVNHFVWSWLAALNNHLWFIWLHSFVRREFERWSILLIKGRDLVAEHLSLRGSVRGRLLLRLILMKGRRLGVVSIVASFESHSLASLLVVL